MKRTQIYLLVILCISSFMPANESVAGPSSAEALRFLKEGHARYVNGKSIHPNITANRRRETAKNGQHPFVTILSCADSRVPPEIIFDAGISDLFITRIAGNVADTDEIGTIEYGVEHLGTPLLVIMGHTKCGAVTAVVNGSKVHGSIPPLVDNIIPAVELARAKNGGTESLIIAAIEENIRQAMHDILARSSIVRELIEEKKLVMTGALYDIESGKISWMGAHTDQGKLMSSANNKFWRNSLLLAGGLLLGLFLVFILFVGSKRLVSWMRFRGRFYSTLSGFTSGALACALTAVSTAKHEEEFNTVLFLLPALGVFIFMGLVYTSSINTSLQKYLLDMREFIQKKLEHT